MSPLLSRFTVFTLLASITAGYAPASHSEDTVQELSYGVALFHLYQQKNLAAITEITTASQRGRLEKQSSDAELLLGSLYYEFGLPDESEKIFEQMLTGDEPAAIRNRVWFNLARVQYEKGNYARAADLLSRIDDSLPKQHQNLQNYMLSNIYSRQQKFSEARQAAENINEDSVWAGYARFNLGVQLLNNQADRQWLKALTLQKSRNEEMRALQDSAYYMLGLFALRENYPDEALGYFNKIHMDTPLSNKALLATGWAWYKNYDYQKARKYWRTLLANDAPDAATQEAIVALADSWAKSGDKAQAITVYRQAAAEYDRLLVDLDGLIEMIHAPAFVEGLLNKQLTEPRAVDKQDVENQQSSELAFYLYGLISTNDFQMALENYRQLLEMQQILEQWQEKVPVFELMLAERKQAFLARKQQLDMDINEQNLKVLQAARERFAVEVQRIEKDQDFRSLANEDELDYREQLDEVERLIGKLQARRDMDEAKQKYRLLSGLLDYRLETEFPARFWALSHQLQLLDRALVKANEAVNSLEVSARENELRLTDFDQRINGQQQVIKQRLQRVDQLLDRQRTYLDYLAIGEIERRKRHTLALRLTARSAAARLLDELAQQSSAQEDLKQ